MNRIIKYILFDIVKNKVVVGYTILLALFSWTAFSLEDNSSKGLFTLLNIILLIVPLVSILFSTIYIYNSSEFIELLLSQPIARRKLWWSLFMSLSLSLLSAFLISAGVPLIVFADFFKALIMILAGSMITIIFVALAFLSSIMSTDKAKGIGISILFWLYFALLFDGLVLFLLFQLSAYPIEKIMVIITAFSPIDLARIMILLQLDASAMMGYTGAIFKDFFGTTYGMVLSFLLLFSWIVVPFGISLKRFKTKDM